MGCGNAVCGSSAIGAVSPVLNSSREEIGLSISVVNLLGTIGIFMIPALAKLTHLTDVQLPIFIGTSLQAVGQVAAAGFTIGTEAGEQAILVKMIRILMLGVLIVVLKLCFSVRGTQTDKKATLTDYVPVFMLVFIAFSLLRTFAQLPEWLIDGASNLQHVLLLTAMAAIGASINFKKLIHQTPKVLIFATANWAVQLIFLLLVFKVLAGFF